MINNINRKINDQSIRQPIIAKLSLYLAFLVTTASCKKFVEIDAPVNRVVTATVFSDDSYAQSAMSGVYKDLVSGGGFASGSQNSITVLSGLSSDEFFNYTHSPFYENALASVDPAVGDLWNGCYRTIYLANSILKGLDNSTGVSGTLKQQMTGEAKFLRAFAHFYLTQLFGDVPVVTTTDVTVTRKLSRSPRETVYEQIESDLVAARGLLPETYTVYSNERVRVNKYAASAMLARFYVFKKDWQRAEQEATLVLNNIGQYELLNNLGSVFLKNSREAIWQLIPYDKNVSEISTFKLVNDPGLVSLNTDLVNSFDPSDKRKAEWIRTYTSTLPGATVYYYPFKYRSTANDASEYSMVLRLAEQYLIRAEARLMQNKLTGINSAQSDINAIRTRAGLPNSTAATNDELMTEILEQRKLELFSEWGHRWFDLKRTGKATEVLAPIKPFWNAYDTLYPIPKYDLINNHNLTQNNGYQ